MADLNKNMYLTNNKEILVLLNNIPDEKEIYECIAENYYHKFYSVYTLKVEGMITNCNLFCMVLTFSFYVSGAIHKI